MRKRVRAARRYGDTYRAYDNQADADLSVASCLLCPGMASAPAGSDTITDCECTHPHIEGSPGTACSCQAGYYQVATPCACANTPEDGWITLTGYAARVPWSSADGYTGPDVSRSPDSGSCVLDATVDAYQMLQHDTTGPCHAWQDVVLEPDSSSTHTTLVRCLCPSRPSAQSGHTCEPCPADFFCPAGADIHACPIFAASTQNSVDLQSCVCAAGSELLVVQTNLGICVECAAGKYSSLNECTACPPNTDSPAGSGALSSCVANAGFYQTGDGTVVACTSHATSAVGSTSVSDCVCTAGYYYASDACLECDMGTYKAGSSNEACTACPPNADHTLTQQVSVAPCVCNQGFTGAGTACVQCSVGTYKTGPGSDACEICGAHETSPAGSTSAAACVCTAGHSLHDGGCQACSVGSYKEFSGNSGCIACPATEAITSTTSTAGSTTANACVCPPGATGSADAQVETSAYNGAAPEAKIAFDDIAGPDGIPHLIPSANKILSAERL